MAAESLDHNSERAVTNNYKISRNLLINNICLRTTLPKHNIAFELIDEYC